MPIIDGKKFACQSCVKGHRVSGCTHTNRPLQHINPKGRPVKQCEHCRGARKSKSHHARCECGDKKDNGDSKGETLGGNWVEAISDPAIVEHRGCGCHDGAKCICGLKKDSHVNKLDSSSQKSAQHPKPKPKLTTAHSEMTLTVFANGHHKPCHRLNNTAHTSGLPYRIPRPHTLHGMPIHSSDGLERIYGKSQEEAQRSWDNLVLSGNSFQDSFSLAQRSVDSLPLTGLTGAFDLGAVKFDLSSIQINRSAEPLPEPTSQDEGVCGDALVSAQWPWLDAFASSNDPIDMEKFSTSPTTDYLANVENDWAIPSAGLNPLWSAGDLPLDPSKLAENVVQPISHSGESSRVSVPGLTTSSSGAQSEVGESALFGDLEIRGQDIAEGTFLWEDNLRSPDRSSHHPRSSVIKDQQPGPTSVLPTNTRQSLDLNLLTANKNWSSFEQSVEMGSEPPCASLESDSSRPVNVVGVSPSFLHISNETGDNAECVTVGDDARSISIPNTIDEGEGGRSWFSLSEFPTGSAQTSSLGVLGLPAYPWLS